MGSRLVMEIPIDGEFTWQQVIAASNIFAERCPLVARSGKAPNVAVDPREWFVDFHDLNGAWYVIADDTGDAIFAPDDDATLHPALYISLYGCVKGCDDPPACNHPAELGRSVPNLAIAFAKCLLEVSGRPRTSGAELSSAPRPTFLVSKW